MGNIFCSRASPENLLLAKPEVLGAAAGVLKVTAAVRAPNDGSWMVYRPLYEMMAPLDEVLTKVEDWLMALLAAMDGVIERIIFVYRGNTGTHLSASSVD